MGMAATTRSRVNRTARRQNAGATSAAISAALRKPRTN